MRKRSIPGSGSRTERERTVQVPAGGGEGGFCAPALKETVREGGTPRYRGHKCGQSVQTQVVPRTLLSVRPEPIAARGVFLWTNGRKKEETP